MTTSSSATRLGSWRGFLRVHATLIRDLGAELEASEGMTISAFDVLVQLAEAPKQRLRMAELADAVLLTPSGLTRLVDRLVGEGLVERVKCEDDGRSTYAAMTREGRRRFRAASRRHVAGVRTRFVDQLTPAEHDALDALWARLLPQWKAR